MPSADSSHDLHWCRKQTSRTVFLFYFQQCHLFVRWNEVFSHFSDDCVDFFSGHSFKYNVTQWWRARQWTDDFSLSSICENIRARHEARVYTVSVLHYILHEIIYIAFPSEFQKRWTNTNSHTHTQRGTVVSCGKNVRDSNIWNKNIQPDTLLFSRHINKYITGNAFYSYEVYSVSFCYGHKQKDNDYAIFLLFLHLLHDAFKISKIWWAISNESDQVPASVNAVVVQYERTIRYLTKMLHNYSRFKYHYLLAYKLIIHSDTTSVSFRFNSCYFLSPSLGIVYVRTLSVGHSPIIMSAFNVLCRAFYSIVCSVGRLHTKFFQCNAGNPMCPCTV